MIIYPTETAYAVGCAATDEKAIERIFQIKGRAKRKTLPLIVGSLAMAKKWFLFNKKELALAKKFWPGPLTLVLPIRRKPTRLFSAIAENRRVGRKRLSRQVVAKNDTAAVRVSGSRFVRRLVEALGEPLVSTSANISGRGECYSLSAAKKQLGEKMKLVDLAVDAGRLPKRLPSTIARVEDGKITVLREGPIKLERLVMVIPSEAKMNPNLKDLSQL